MHARDTHPHFEPLASLISLTPLSLQDGCRYQADETPMASYVNTHGLLEQRRRAAKAAGSRGPRTFVSPRPVVSAAMQCSQQPHINAVEA